MSTMSTPLVRSLFLLFALFLSGGTASDASTESENAATSTENAAKRVVGWRPGSHYRPRRARQYDRPRGAHSLAQAQGREASPYFDDAQTVAQVDLAQAAKRIESAAQKSERLSNQLQSNLQNYHGSVKKMSNNVQKLAVSATHMRAGLEKDIDLQEVSRLKAFRSGDLRGTAGLERLQQIEGFQQVEGDVSEGDEASAVGTARDDEDASDVGEAHVGEGPPLTADGTGAD
jgi:hypothetical protein